jgi:hypothetical protein
MPSKAPNASDAEPLPSPEVRGVVGLFIFIHLFCVALALASYANSSPLESRLMQVMGPYVSTLNFDLMPNLYPTGRFYLTHAENGDVDFSIEVESTLPDGTVEKVTIPEADLPLGQWRHYQALANAAGSMAISENVEPVLLRSIAGAILRSAGASKGLVRVRDHKLVPIELADSSDPTIRDPLDRRYYSTVYEAHVLVSPTGQVDLVKRSAAGEVAPVQKGTTDASAP